MYTHFPHIHRMKFNLFSDEANVDRIKAFYFAQVQLSFFVAAISSIVRKCG